MTVGRKTGGRRKGIPNKATMARETAIAASGLTPLDYFLSVMRDATEETATRLYAARAAAPYVHPRRLAVEHSGPGGSPARQITEVMWKEPDRHSSAPPS